MPYISSQYEVMYKIHDLRHCRIHSPLCVLRRREFDGCAIAQKAARKKQIVNICRGCFATLGVHVERQLLLPERQNDGTIECKQSSSRRRLDGSGNTSAYILSPVELARSWTTERSSIFDHSSLRSIVDNLLFGCSNKLSGACFRSAMFLLVPFNPYSDMLGRFPHSSYLQ